MSRARIVALALGVGALGSLVGAPAAFAARPPLLGSACAADGHINGAGSTFQSNGINDALTYGFMLDVCGRTPGPESNLNMLYSNVNADPSDYTFTAFSGATVSVDGMVAYNYALSGTNASSGSGAGITRMNCRTDFFAGTDLPYNTNQLTQAQSVPGTSVNCGSLNTATVPPPFGPQSSVGYPNTSDAAASMMAFPIAGGAVAIATNLNGMCLNGTPTGLNITADELNKIWQGTINQWNDPELVLTNPVLGPTMDNCSGNIQRVVRFDNSGTTSILMNTLYGIDLNNSDDGADLCGTENSPQPAAFATEHTWYNIGTSSNNSTAWPKFAGTGGTFPTQDCVDVNGNHALDPVTGGSNGSPALISKVLATNGSIGYAETGLWPSLPANGVSFVNLQTFADFSTAGNGLSNATPSNDSNNNSPWSGPGNAGAKSLCNLPAAVPTGPNSIQAVGLGNPNWTNSGTNVGALVTPGKQDIAWSSEGAGYPACGLTFDMVYKGVDNTSSEVGGAGGTAGCTSNPATTTPGQALNTSTLTVASTTGFPTSGVVEVSNGTSNQYLTYTGITATTFTGIPTSGSGSGTGTAPANAAVTLITGGCQSAAGPLQGATNDQLRTLYAYFTYVFSPLGQSTTYLPAVTLDPVPATWLTEITQGFQNNF